VNDQVSQANKTGTFVMSYNLNIMLQIVQKKVRVYVAGLNSGRNCPNLFALGFFIR
jgi:hypothetical protein